MEGIFPGLLKQLMFNSDECGLAETLQRQDHSIGQQAVHQDPAQQVQSRHKSDEQPSLSLCFHHLEVFLYAHKIIQWWEKKVFFVMYSIALRI